MSEFQHHEWQAVDRVVVWAKCKNTYQKRVRKQIQELLQQIEQALADAPCKFLSRLHRDPAKTMQDLAEKYLAHLPVDRDLSSDSSACVVVSALAIIFLRKIVYQGMLSLHHQRVIQALTTIHRYYLAGNMGSLVRGKKSHQVGMIFFSSHFSRRDQLYHGIQVQAAFLSSTRTAWRYASCRGKDS